MSNCRDEDNGGEVINSQPVISSCDTLPVLEMAEHPLKGVAAAVCCAIERIGNLLEQALPQPTSRPSVVAILDCGGWTTLGQHIPPAAADLVYVQDAADHAPIADAWLARAAMRQVRL